MSETYPEKNHCETLFAGHIPSSVGIGCKGSEKFAHLQIFQLKVYSLKFMARKYPNVIRQAPHNTASECYRGPQCRV